MMRGGALPPPVGGGRGKEVEHQRRRQRGLATVEAMLALPLLLVVLVLAEQTLHLLLLKQHNVTVARTAAWRKALFDSPCPTWPQTERGGTLWGATCAQSPPSSGGQESWNAASAFLNPLAQGEHRSQLVTAIRQAGEPARITATARAQYQPLGNDFVILPFFQDRHSLEPLAPAWRLAELELGHDRYLREKLTTSRLFRELFPRAP